jgi:hypothetical protein
MAEPARVVVCTLGGDGNPWELPVSRFVGSRWIGGGLRTLHELAVAIAATGRPVELRGMVFKPTLDELSAATGTPPLLARESRRPSADDLVIVPEGWTEPMAYARLAFSPARTVLLLLAPPGLFGWSFAPSWSRPSALTVDLAQLARPEHFQAMASLGFELWTPSERLAETARAAGVACKWIGNGQPTVPAQGCVKTIDVVWIEDNKWASLARRVAAGLHVPHRSIPSSPHEDLLRQLGEGRVLLWPSRIEGHARISVEARAVGTVPVALSTNPYAAGLSEEGGCVVVDSLEDMPAAVHALLAQAGRLAELSTRAVKTAREQIDWSTYLTRVDGALSQPAPHDPGRGTRTVIGSQFEAVFAGLRVAEARLWRPRLRRIVQRALRAL